MKNYAAIILALIAFDLSGQTLGIARFLFEPVIRPLDYRPPEDFNASRGRGSHHGVNNRLTPSVFGSLASTDYSSTAVDFSVTHDYNDGTYDQNSSTYNMPFGQIYHGADLPIQSLTVGNPLNSLNERWHTRYSPDVVLQNLDRFTPPDNRYNPNLTLHGTLAESPWGFYAAPQISMADRQNNVRNPVGLMRSDGLVPYTRGQRLTTLSWDAMNDIDGTITGVGSQMERLDAIEMGDFFQDGLSTVNPANPIGTFLCDGHFQTGNPPAPTVFHTWESRHFSSIGRAGMDAKRSIPMDGIYAYIGDPTTIHDFHLSGGTDVRKRRHWDWKTGNTGNKPVWNTGWCLEIPGGFVPLTDCDFAIGTLTPPLFGTFYYITSNGRPALNEKYSVGAPHNLNTGNDGNGSSIQDADLGGPYLGLPYRLTGTTSSLSELGGVAIYADSEMELAQDDTKTELAGHPVELEGSSLSPWDEAFGYDLSRFFGDFYVEPSVWSINMNDTPGAGPDLAGARIAGSADFMNPLDRRNQISTRSMTDVLRMGDLGRRIRHINRFPQSGLDYLFHSEFVAPNGNRTPIYTQ